MEFLRGAYFNKEHNKIVIGKRATKQHSDNTMVALAIKGTKILNQIALLVDLDDNGDISKVYLPIKARTEGSLTGGSNLVVTINKEESIMGILPYLTIKKIKHITRWYSIQYNLEEAREVNKDNEGILKAIQMIEDGQS